MLLENLIVAVVVRRPKQIAGHSTAVDDQVIALWRLNLDLRNVKEKPKVFLNDMRDCALFIFKGNSIRDGQVDRRRLASGSRWRSRRCFGMGRVRRFSREHDYKALGFANDSFRDVK